MRWAIGLLAICLALVRSDPQQQEQFNNNQQFNRQRQCNCNQRFQSNQQFNQYQQQQIQFNRQQTQLKIQQPQFNRQQQQQFNRQQQPQFNRQQQQIQFNPQQTQLKIQQPQFNRQQQQQFNRQQQPQFNRQQQQQFQSNQQQFNRNQQFQSNQPFIRNSQLKLEGQFIVNPRFQQQRCDCTAIYSWKGPLSNIWTSPTCTLTKAVPVSLALCKSNCQADSTCSAINYKPATGADAGCVLVTCDGPTPLPQGWDLGYKGFNLTRAAAAFG